MLFCKWRPVWRGKRRGDRKCAMTAYLLDQMFSVSWMVKVDSPKATIPCEATVDGDSVLRGLGDLL
jgi:hypothetical protein